MSPAVSQAARMARSPRRSPDRWCAGCRRRAEQRPAAGRGRLCRCGEPARQFGRGDEDAGDEAERQHDGQQYKLAASMLPMRPAREQKTTAPTMMSRTKVGALRPGRDALSAAQPMNSRTVRALETFQIGVVQGIVTVSVKALSYAGQLKLNIVADPPPCPTRGLRHRDVGCPRSARHPGHSTTRVCRVRVATTQCELTARSLGRRSQMP